jgi:peptide deformylase
VTILKVVEWPAKVLSTPAAPVEKFDAELAKFVRNMHETMSHAKGIGLAANQVGDLRRVLVINIPWHDDDAEGEAPEIKEWWHDKSFTIINPKITKIQNKTRYMEGCLSFPEMYDYVQRSSEVWLDFQDETGKKHSIHATGLLAICLQHEIDHLDGIVFIDRMSRLKANSIKKKMNQRPALSSMERELSEA